MTPATKKIINPYAKKKFIGGAEAARQEARKKVRRPATKILTPTERQRLDEILPQKMNAMERFFAAMLRSSAEEFCASDKDNAKALTLWTTVCRRLGLTPPAAPLLACYEQVPQQHFALRAALVLEEARYALTQPLATKWMKSRGRRGPVINMVLTAHYVEKTAHGHTKVIFRKEGTPFLRDELFELRSGTVLECLAREGPRALSAVHLGAILSGNREQIEAKRCFTVTFFRQMPDMEGTEWMIRPLDTLVTQLRSYEAMTVKPHQIAFVSNLLGAKPAIHTRFDAKDTAVKAKSISDYFAPVFKESEVFTLPKLNETQEMAATSFLQAKPNTITLIQGPPGTGKTTLLVSVIARYLMEHGEKRRIMVCAPTNKAISVLATRFMASFAEDKANFSAVMVGDADKLLSDEKSTKQQYSTRKLRSIFVYSWMQTVIEDYRKIRNYFMPSASKRGTSAEEVYLMAARLEKRLLNGLYGFSESLFAQANKITKKLKVIESGGGYDVAPLVSRFCEELGEIQKTQKNVIWGLLLANANVIFCTLASAGGMVLRNSPKIDDLVVDEAAAATEPELCIPLHMSPKRLLCVGDPLQLPATVLSRRAIDLGLAQSLHERLMYHCNFDHVMLDVQYRMNPEISAFPSLRFYDSKIRNGSNVQRPDHRNGPLLLDSRPYIFVNTKGAEEHAASGSYRNHAEAKTVVELVRDLRGQSTTSATPWHSADRIRVITFYQGQVGLIKHLLRDQGFGEKVVVATVDSSQGCEADIVLVSFVRSPHQAGLGARVAAGFLTDDRRVNVALTRARYQLICIGNADGLAQIDGAETINRLAKDAMARQVVRPLAEDQTIVDFYD